jgi:hypothetical protein
MRSAIKRLLEFLLRLVDGPIRNGQDVIPGRTTGRYYGPDDEEGWDLVLKNGHIVPERRPGYTGPLPDPVKRG